MPNHTQGTKGSKNNNDTPREKIIEHTLSNGNILIPMEKRWCERSSETREKRSHKRKKLMFLSASYKYHNDNEKYSTNNLKCVWSFMLDKDVDDKTRDRESELKDACLGSVRMLDAPIVHRRPENARQQGNSSNYQKKLRRISRDRQRFASSYERSNTESDKPEESHEPKTEGSHRARFISLVREIS